MLGTGADTEPTQVGLKVVGAAAGGGGANVGGGALTATKLGEADADGALQVEADADGGGGGTQELAGGVALGGAGGATVAAVTGQTVVLTGTMTVVSTVLWAGQLSTSGPQLVIVWVVVLKMVLVVHSTPPPLAPPQVGKGRAKVGVGRSSSSHSSVEVGFQWFSVATAQADRARRATTEVFMVDVEVLWYFRRDKMLKMTAGDYFGISNANN